MQRFWVILISALFLYSCQVLPDIPQTNDKDLFDRLADADTTIVRDTIIIPEAYTYRPQLPDNAWRVFDNADPSKKFAFEASGITTGNTRTGTVPDYDFNMGILPTVGAFTQGSVIIADANGRLDEDNTNLFYDDANNILRIGNYINFTSNSVGIFSTSTTNPTNTGNHGVFIGTDAGAAVASSGDHNTLIGYRAGYQATTANHNVLIGRSAGEGITEGVRNVLIGREAGQNITTANGNIVLGDGGNLLSTGNNNVFVGTSTADGNAAITGERNVVLGTNALQELVSGGNNVMIGSEVARNFESGNSNVAIGQDAYGTSTDIGVDYIVALGYRALYNSSVANSDNNIAIGRSAGALNAFTDVMILGNSAVADANNQIVLGSSTYTQLRSVNYRFNIDQALGAGQDGYVMTYNNTSGEFEAAAGGSDTHFANTNLTFDANRTHDLATFDLTINEGGGNTMMFFDESLERIHFGSNVAPTAKVEITTTTDEGLLVDKTGTGRGIRVINNANSGESVTNIRSDLVSGIGTSSDYFSAFYDATKVFGFNGQGSLTIKPSTNASLSTSSSPHQFKLDQPFDIDGSYSRLSFVASSNVVGNIATQFTDWGQGYGQLEFYTSGASNPITNLNMTLKETGQFQLNGYTGTTFDASPSKTLGVDASGNVITFTGTTNTNFANTDLSLDANRTHNLNDFDLTITDDSGDPIISIDESVNNQGNVGIGMAASTDVNEVLSVGRNDDGGQAELVIDNTFPATAGSTDELARLRFHFGGNLAALIHTYKLEDFTSNANNSAGMRLRTRFNDSFYDGIWIKDDAHVGINIEPDVALDVKDNNSVTGNIAPVQQLLATTSTSLSAGYGAGVQYIIQAGAGSENIIAQTAGVWDGADNTGGFTIELPTTGTLNERFRLSATGALQLNAYGSGTFTGTATRLLGVDASGNVIEEALVTNTNFANADLTATGNRTHTFAGNDLTISTTGNANSLFVQGSTGRVGINTATTVGGSVMSIAGAVQMTDGNNNIIFDSRTTTIPGLAGTNNIHIGNSTTSASDGGTDNIAIGRIASPNITTGLDNISIGRQSGNSLTTGFYNIAIGLETGDNVTTGSNNVNIGRRAGGAMTIGQNYVNIGTDAGLDITEGRNGVNIGSQAGQNITTSWWNVNVGQIAGESITTGEGNVYVGYRAGNSTTTGAHNIAIGHLAAAFSAGSGDPNSNNSIAIGYEAAKDATVLESNIFIGRLAGNTNALANVIAIGNNTDADQANQIVLGDGGDGYTQLRSTNYRFNIDQTLGAGQDGYVMTYNNTSGELELAAAGSDTHFANTDLTATGNRTHTFAGNDLTISTTGDANNFVIDGSAGRIGIGIVPTFGELQTNGPEGVSMIRTTTGTNSAEPVLYLNLDTSSDAVDGFGPGMNFNMRDDAGTYTNMANLDILRDGADSRGSFVFSVNGRSTENMRLHGSDGQLQLNTYGGGTHTGTATRLLGVDASGNVIEEALVTNTNFAENDLTATGDRTHTFASNDLIISTTGSANTLSIDGANGRIGIGTDPSRVFHVLSSDVSWLERTTSNTNEEISALILEVESTGDMADGFGSALSFHISDNGSQQNNIGRISAVRNGADDTGALEFKLATAGIIAPASAVKMRIENTGAFQINEYGSGTFTGTATRLLGVDASGNVIEEALVTNTNFANTNLTFDANRTHNLNDFDLTLNDDGGNPIFAIDESTRYVGIGTNTPDSHLDIEASTAATLILQNTSTAATENRILFTSSHTGWPGNTLDIKSGGTRGATTIIQSWSGISAYGWGQTITGNESVGARTWNLNAERTGSVDYTDNRKVLFGIQNNANDVFTVFAAASGDGYSSIQTDGRLYVGGDPDNHLGVAGIPYDAFYLKSFESAIIRGGASSIDIMRLETNAGTQVVTFDDAGQLGIFNNTPSVPLDVNIDNASTTGLRTSAQFLATTTGDMVDDYGSGIQFLIDDAGTTEQIVGAIGAVRDNGTDNNGSLVFLYANTLGVLTEGARLDYNGDFAVGTSTASSDIDFGSLTGAMEIPTGSTATRGTAVQGQLRFSTSFDHAEIYSSDHYGRVPTMGTDRLIADDTNATFAAGDRGAIVSMRDNSNNSTKITYTLPASPVDGERIYIYQRSGGNVDANDGVQILGNGNNIEGAANYDHPGPATIEFRYSATLGEWYVI